MKMAKNTHCQPCNYIPQLVSNSMWSHTHAHSLRVRQLHTPNSHTACYSQPQSESCTHYGSAYSHVCPHKTACHSASPTILQPLLLKVIHHPTWPSTPIIVYPNPHVALWLPEPVTPPSSCPMPYIQQVQVLLQSPQAICHLLRTSL